MAAVSFLMTGTKNDVIQVQFFQAGSPSSAYDVTNPSPTQLQIVLTSPSGAAQAYTATLVSATVNTIAISTTPTMLTVAGTWSVEGVLTFSDGSVAKSSVSYLNVYQALI